jgi:hypothetical protein
LLTASTSISPRPPSVSSAGFVSPGGCGLGVRYKNQNLDAAENAHTREIETLASLDANAAAITAMRTRIIARFTELEAERATITTQLAALAKTSHDHSDPGYLDALPDRAGTPHRAGVVPRAGSLIGQGGQSLMIRAGRRGWPPIGQRGRPR